MGIAALDPSYDFRLATIGNGDLVDHFEPGLGEPRHAVVELDQAALGQKRQIVIADGGENQTLGIDVAQRPTQMYRALQSKIGEGILMVDHGALSAMGRESSLLQGKVAHILFPFC